MCNATFNRILGRRQSLPYYLTAKYLRAANIAAIATKNIVFNSLQTQ